MAEQVRISKGNTLLTVSRKSFDTIYAGKGFSIVGGAAAEKSKEPATTSAPKTAGASRARFTSKAKAARKSSKKDGAKGSTKGAVKDTADSTAGSESGSQPAAES